MNQVRVLNLDQQEKKVSNIIRRLLREKGIKKYAVFDYIEEASKVLPGGIFPVSGKVLTKTGKLYSFWRESDPKNYLHNEDYQRAKKRLGII